MHQLFVAGLALALAAPLTAAAQTPSDAPADANTQIQALRREIDAMRAEYEARLRGLEQRLKAAEAAAATSAGGAPSAAAPAAVSPAGGPNAFNPSISLILSGLYTRTSQDPAAYAISGVALPKDVPTGPGTRGFSLAESELGLAANIDPWLRGAANIALLADNTVSVEEAYAQTTSLGHGFSLKAGRFFSSVGYLNPQHMHTWDFVDNPLAYQAFLGTQYGDDGVQLTWIAPTDQYIELGAELGRGHDFPGSDTGHNGPGMTALIAHTGGDVGDSNSWRAGLSTLDAKADNQSLVAMDRSGGATTNAFTGSTRVWLADAIWKWAPHGNATRTNFKVQGEYLRSTRSGSLIYDVGHLNRPGAFRAEQAGWYLQSVYQFIPRWRIGLRTDQLSPGTPDYGINANSFASTGYRPSRNTLMLDFSPSEFSRIRLQMAQDRARQGFTDNELFLQYLMSLGAHGAHSF